MAQRPFTSDRVTAQAAEQDDPLALLAARAAKLNCQALAATEKRAISYLQAGFPLHLRGPAGSGKTTMALRLAEQLRRPVMMLVGDASFDTRTLVGSEGGTRTRRVIDRYISSVMKVESETETVWLDQTLTIACTEGCTLLYDEFNRAPATANNVLLTVLEERILALPRAGRDDSYMRVHPEFRAIFTSNPVDHVGTNLAQDALVDRMVTLDLDGFSREAEIDIVTARTGISVISAARIVDIVRDFRASREYSQRPTFRAAVMIAQMVGQQALHASSDDAGFVQLCIDILASKLKPGPDGLPLPSHVKLLHKLIDHFCPPFQRIGGRAGKSTPSHDHQISRSE
jgi:gas vesicle protein GvpN